jgi:cytochrome c-type biogenesis protein CcsB
MKKIVSFLFSMFFTGILIVIFAIAIAYATFIENDFGTTTAKVLIYNSWWFEVLLVILSLNLIGSMINHKLFSRKKWPILLFHLSFILIVIGAGVTRYFGFEGNMHIREGEASNSIVSTESFVTIKASQNGVSATSEKAVMFSPYTANRYSATVKVNGKSINIKNLQYMPSAKEIVIPVEGGEPIISILAVDSQMQAIEFLLKQRDIKTIDDNSIGFSTEDTNIRFETEGSDLYFTAFDSVAIASSLSGEKTVVPANKPIKIEAKKIYSLGKLIFTVQDYFPQAKTDLVYSKPNKGMALPDAIKTLVTVGNESKEIIVSGTQGEQGNAVTTRIDGIDISLSYGAKLIELPFSLYLNEFQLERYPGSNSPSSFASEVILKDGGIEKPFRIFMNNILKYKGYRFFQSSYDRDEMGTILSVSHDALGTGITYFGYFIMTLGMVFGLFNKNSRLKTLLNASSKLREDRKKFFAVLVLGVLFSFSANAQSADIPKDHISDFGELLIQNPKGRIEPVNSMASDILRKVAKKTSWEGMSPTEVFLGMQASPEQWKNVVFIKVSNSELRRQLGILNGKYTSFNAIVLPREMGGYKLSALVQQAYQKKSNERNKYDKEIIYVDERVNILMNVFEGEFLTAFPVPNHENNKWVSAVDQDLLSEEMRAIANETIGNYFKSVAASDWATAIQILQSIKENQKQFGGKVLPSSTKVKLEVLYNNLNIFGKLAKIFMFTGLFLLMLQLATVFNPRIKFTSIKNIFFIFIFLLFFIETTGLGIRWYISNHAPWSNGYESMIFISWATCLGGLIFARRSQITLALTTVLAGLTLMVAGMSWMSPEITNLVPVLKSYWLIVHVAIITSSYGFLGISALLGLLNLILMVFRNKKNTDRINFTVKELVNIIQIALIIGLLMLTVGSFLGGVWANESWGRYWGWDPKETWALVTILVYTFISHMHKIPGFKGEFAISSGAVVGFSSVLMTYFGVNYYLSGLHSYAQGEAAPIPAGVYIAIFVVVVLIISAFFSEKLSKQKIKNN